MVLTPSFLTCRRRFGWSERPPVMAGRQASPPTVSMEPVLALHSSCITVHKAREEIRNYANALPQASAAHRDDRYRPGNCGARNIHHQSAGHCVPCPRDRDAAADDRAYFLAFTKKISIDSRMLATEVSCSCSIGAWSSRALTRSNIEAR